MRQLHHPGEYKCSLKETGKYIGSYFSVGENLVLLRCDVDPEALIRLNQAGIRHYTL